MVIDIARPVFRRARKLAATVRRRCTSVVRELGVPADLRSSDRYLASERRDQYRRARLAAAVMAGYAVGAVPVVAIVGQQRRLDVVGVAGLWAVVALALWRVVAPRMRRDPTVISILVVAAATGSIMTTEALEPDLHSLAIGFLTIVPLASTILLFWRPRTHIAVLGLFFAATVVYATVTSPFDEPSVRAALIVASGVACLLGVFGNYEGTLRRNARARQARRLQSQRLELRRVARERAEEARTDVLTGLGSRRAMNEDLAELHGRLAAAGHPAALALLDLDRFKLFNDQYGHAAGDELLVEIGRHLREGLRQGDAAYRYGGEEFLLILEDASVGESETIVERIRTAVRKGSPDQPANERWRAVTFSAGIAAIDLARSVPIEYALHLADRGLYEAKGLGRNRTVIKMSDSQTTAGGTGTITPSNLRVRRAS